MKVYSPPSHISIAGSQRGFDARNRLVDIRISGSPVANRYAHATHATPCNSAEPGDTIGLNVGDNAIGMAIMVAVSSTELLLLFEVSAWPPHDGTTGEVSS